MGEFLAYNANRIIWYDEKNQLVDEWKGGIFQISDIKIQNAEMRHLGAQLNRFFYAIHLGALFQSVLYFTFQSQYGFTHCSRVRLAVLTYFVGYMVVLVCGQNTTALGADFALKKAP